MATFNIQNSSVEQLNDQGNNVKVTGNSGHTTISEQGNIVQTSGDGNRVRVDSPKQTFGSMLWKKVVACWHWIFG